MKDQKEISVECSINLHKRTYGIKFRNRASRAIKEIRYFAQKIMSVKNVRIDSILNKEICKNGSKNVPFRIKIRLFKKHCISENGDEMWIVFVTSLKNILSK
mmetsp:Transcript_57741/g.135537  ORF Transcript_57741/g.135537 Transcript_57741/m.135537 type:complete len:102 (+) Transcript_57741:648-953(+)